MLSTSYLVPTAAMAHPIFPDHCFIRYDHHHRNDHKDLMRWRIRTSAATRAYPLFSNQIQLTKDSSSRHKLYQEALKTARDKFTREISFQSKDKDISLAKALLYIAAEDEAFMSFNREMDTRSLLNERRNVSSSLETEGWVSLEEMPLGGKTIPEWLSELDAIAKEVEAELVSRDIGCHLVEVLEAVNLVLFELRGLTRSPVLVDSKHSYLHSVLDSRCGSGKASFYFLFCSKAHLLQSIFRRNFPEKHILPYHFGMSTNMILLITAILLSIIYIEICWRLGLTIVGSRVGEDFLIWPQTGYPEELFKVTSGHSLFAIVNGKCVEDPRSMASDLTGTSLLGLEIATNRDIIGIALANLIRLHWKHASRSNHGLMLTSPLRHVHDAGEKPNMIDESNIPLLRTQYLRLAIMASERLLILQPHNWALRRDHGMMLYYNREYGKAVQELSICMAFAPEEEAEILEPFVEKLHLMRLESSWKSLGHAGRLTVP